MSKVFLGDIAKERRENCKDSKNGYPIVGLEHLAPEEIILSAWEENKVNSFSKLFQKGDMLFGRRRAYLKKAAVAPFDGICSGDITVIEPIPEKIIPELLPFIIQNDSLFDFAIGKSAGSLSPRVKWEHLKNYEFKLPNMDKQRELAKMLWAMDATKKSYQKLLQKTDELVKSQFIEMFGDPKGKDGYREKGSRNFRFASGRMNPTYQLDDSFPYPCYGGNGITGYSKEFIIESRTIAIGRVGAYCGSIHTTQKCSWITDNAIYIKEYDPAKYSLVFLYHQFLLADFNRFADFVGQPKITQKPLEQFEYLTPPIDMQNKYAAFVEQVDKSKFELEQALAELTATYKKIISENLC